MGVVQHTHEVQMLYDIVDVDTGMILRENFTGLGSCQRWAADHFMDECEVYTPDSKNQIETLAWRDELESKRGLCETPSQIEWLEFELVKAAESLQRAFYYVKCR